MNSESRAASAPTTPGSVSSAVGGAARRRRKDSRAILADSGVSSDMLFADDEIVVADKLAEGGFAEIYRAALSPRGAESPRRTVPAALDAAEDRSLARHRRSRGRSFGRNDAMERPTAAAASGALLAKSDGGAAPARAEFAMKRASLKAVRRGAHTSDAAAADAERERSIAELVKEFQLLAGLHHDNIISLSGIHIDQNDCVSVCLEFCENGSVRDALERQPALTTEQRLSIALDTASGLRYLHRQDIVHCDIKARNVLLAGDYTAKLCDFGLAKKCSNDRVPLAGTKGHLAPELLQFLLDPYDGKSEMIYTKTSDVFSFGIFLHELFTGVDAEKLDFDTEEEIDKLINEQYRPSIPDALRQSDVAIVPLIEECWAQDPAARPSFEEIVPRLEEMLDKHQQAIAHKEAFKKIRTKKKPSFIENQVVGVGKAKTPKQ